MTTWAIVVAVVAAPGIQVLLMGVLGYPRARRDPVKLEAFKHSGFSWWIVTLTILAIVVAVSGAVSLEPFAVSNHDGNYIRMLVVAVIAAALAVAIEAGAEVLRVATGVAAVDRRRYEEVLPVWARRASSQGPTLAYLAFLEELLYRAAVIGALVKVGASDPVAAGVSAAAFGVAHAYFGPRQVLLKTLTGCVFVTAAFAGGWFAAALAHVVMNVVILVTELRSRDAT